MVKSGYSIELDEMLLSQEFVHPSVLTKEKTPQ